MEIVPLTPDLHAAWDDFCLRSPDAWFWHSTAWLEYSLAYRPDMEARSLSFLCKEGDRVMAVVPLHLGRERFGARTVPILSLGGNALPAPALEDGLSPTRRVKMLENLFGIIEGFALEFGVAYSRFQIDPLCPAQLKPREATYNYLLRHQYLDCSIGSQLIDLRLPEAELWDAVRRDHQNNIEKARKSLVVRIHSGPGLTDAQFDAYREMHARAAGRATRPLSTFHMMREWARSAGGFLTEVRLPDGRSVGFELFQTYKGAGFSLSACNEPGYEHLPIRHLIQWESIRRMKELGAEFYEVGSQQFGALPYDHPARKNLDISLFKGGFGGSTVPHFRGERFHERALWEAEKRRRDDLFAAGYAWKAPSDPEQARALLRLAEKAARAPEPRPEETAPIPDGLRVLAADAMSRNPDAVQKFRNGSTKAVAFLVGAAMPQAPKGTDPRLMRRAVEEALAARRTVAILQARMGSERLPGKVLKDLLGAPMLARVVSRTLRAKSLDAVVVATTTDATDDPVAELCARQNWRVYRGSPADLLDRYYQAAKLHGADTVVRITCDCPMIDPEVIDRVVAAFREGEPVDYATNTLPPHTFPRGLDVEVLSFAALERAWKEDRDPAWREHVTPYLYRHPELFKLRGVVDERDRSAVRLTVDTPEDFELVRRVYESFGHDRFSWREALALLDAHPDWLEINRHVRQRTVS